MVARGVQAGGAAPLRVAIAEDSLLLRSGIEALLVAHDLEVVASLDSADGLTGLVGQNHLDAVVLDIRMPPTHTDEGLVALEAMRAGGSRVGVLMLSMYATPSYAIRAMSVGGGTGYLLKDRIADPESFVQAVRTVAGGGSVVDPEVVSHLVGTPSSSAIGALTPREREVLTLMAQGKSNGGIAGALFLSLKTVETHISSIMAKLGIDDSPGEHRRVLAVLRLLGS